MTLRALKGGVSETRLASSPNVDVASIRQKRDLLDGVYLEAVHLLKDRDATAKVFRGLSNVKPIRQTEIAEIMCADGNYSVNYA